MTTPETRTLDQRLKRLFPVGMREATDLTITLKCGFELFNTRAYHNYETWSNGWYATCLGKPVAQGETLEELVADLEVWAAATPDSWRGKPLPGWTTYAEWKSANGFSSEAAK